MGALLPKIWSPSSAHASSKLALCRSRNVHNSRSEPCLRIFSWSPLIRDSPKKPHDNRYFLTLFADAQIFGSAVLPPNSLFVPSRRWPVKYQDCRVNRWHPKHTLPFPTPDSPTWSRLWDASQYCPNFFSARPSPTTNHGGVCPPIYL